MDWFSRALVGHSEIAVLLAVGLGFALGRLRYRSISLGAVTGTLIVGVVLGALVTVHRPDGTVATLSVDGPAKNIFFLLFLFALGIRLGPQFVAGLRGTGAPQAVFAVVLALVGFGVVLVVAAVTGLNPGLAAGIAGGGLTQSAIVGVAQGSIAGLAQDPATLKEWSDLVPVAYAVTYLFGTIGTALYCANVAPRLLGITDLPAAAAALERRLGLARTSPDVQTAYLDITRRAYRLTTLPPDVTTAADLEQHLRSGDHHVFVARIRTDAGPADATPATPLAPGCSVVLTARRIDLFAASLAGVAEEVDDPELLGFAIEDLWVVVSARGATGRTVGQLRADPGFRRIYLRGLRRSGHDLPVGDAVTLHSGDEVRLQGPLPLLESVIPLVGHAERARVESSMVVLGLGIAAGALIGVPALRAGGIPVGLSTSVGALLVGLLVGWYRTRRPLLARIPPAADWFLESAGLAFFIAMVGISAGPSFVSGLTRYGVGILLAGVVVTLVPLVVMTLLARWVFRFDPVVALGVLAGSRSSSPAAGALRDASRSSVPMLGYTVPYAVANIVLTVGGAVVVALTA
ncbi:MAG: aspartate-alanine antiporter [Pseudonocardia sp.]|uniref:aspartate-alanine antiporter-like transporter n=1 Tax=unclassified Pseudonocardia TaxID=2619320 RepID=UPI001AC08B91|nr:MULTISPECIES: aspartate-alanine antiporter [unclassified Pseudonocardia]MBN9111581.1 aspartate-alanine antiporter [Pseudonocardia sp.]